MKATVEKLDKHQVLLEIEVEAPRVQKALDQAYRRLVKRVNIPGFRKGKAPRFILER
ncbi:MAG: trigger factor, partial [Moorella sp. (in: firmicutes)]|nr:trigger factor [Moorella sp. (in: firmicutes)]